MSSLSYFIFVLVAIIIGVVVVKKVTGCLIRLVVVSMLLAILAYLYFTYFSAYAALNYTDISPAMLLCISFLTIPLSRYMPCRNISLAKAASTVLS